MQVIITPKALKDLKQLHKVSQILIIERLKKLETGSPATSIERLAGYKNAFRVRVGNYRVVYRIIGRKIYVVLIGHRKDVYRKLGNLLRRRF